MKRFITLLLAAGALISTTASATLLTTKLHVDNTFKAYISTSDKVEGTLFSEGADWHQGILGQTTLKKGQTYFLHIYANDWDQMGGMLGMLSLDGTDHVFGNGTQSLLTGASHWKANTTGFDGNYSQVSQWGPNGVGPWTTIDGMSADARWIWSGHALVEDHVYFTTMITATTTADVPEPASFALLGLGLAGFAASRRRR